MGFLWIGAAAVLIFFLQEFLFRKYWDKGLSAHLFFAQEAVREGGQGELKEVIQNRKWMPLPVLHVNLQSDRSFRFFSRENTAVSDMVYRRDVFSLLPSQQVTRTLPFAAAKRGYYQCKEVELVGFTFFFQGPYVKKQPQSALLYVYPKRIPMEPVETACQEMLGEYRQKKRLYEDPFAFKGIRGYEPVDSFRQVNWKASGKTGQLMVNVYEHMAEEKVQILLNLEGDRIWTDDLLQEGVIRIGAALAEQWIAMGVPVGLQTNGCDKLTGTYVGIGQGAGPEHAKAILQALSRIDLSMPEFPGRKESMAGFSDFETHDGLFLYISGSQREEEQQYLEDLRRKGVQVLWIRPCTWKQKQEQKQQLEQKQRRQGSGAADRFEVGDSGDSGTIYQGRVMEWRVEE